MRTNLFLLTKIELAKFVSSFHSKRKLSHAPIAYAALLILALFLALSFLYSWLLLLPFVQSETDPGPVLAFFAGTASMFIFMSTMTQARGIYIGEDYDLLSAMPIRKRDIVASKILSLYAVEWLFSAIIMIPHSVMLIAFAHNVPLCLIALLLAFALPIVPAAIAIFVSLFVTMATSKFKSANTVFAIVYAILIVGLSAMIMVMNNLKQDQAVSGFTSIGNVLKWINPSYFFVELALTQNYLYLLAFVGINLLVILASVLFLALLYDKLHDIVSSVSMKKNYVRKELKTRSQGKVLLGLEFRRLFNSRFYFVTAIMGGIMGIMGSTVFLISMNNALSSAPAEAQAAMKAAIVPIFITILALIFGMGNPAATSINIEGKTFWLSKSLPVDYRRYLHAKLRFAWILTVPAALIASTICVIFRHDNPWDIVFLYVLPLLLVLLSSLIGLIVAIHHPKLKWNSEAEAVKNSASAVISLLINMGMTLVLGPILIVPPLVLDRFGLGFLGYLIALAGLILAIIPCAVYLHRNFAKKIQAIEEL